MENKLTQPAAQTKSSPPQILVHAFATDFVGSATGAVEDAHWIRGEASARLASDVRRMRNFIVVGCFVFRNLKAGGIEEL
jgi:hypothetical protein